MHVVLLALCLVTCPAYIERRVDVYGEVGLLLSGTVAGRPRAWPAEPSAVGDAVLAYYRGDGLGKARTEAINGLLKGSNASALLSQTA